MTLIIVHYHLRPGGVRRIIEVAAPHLVRSSPSRITRIIVAVGEASDGHWLKHFESQFPGVTVEVFVVPAFRYLSEQRGEAPHITRRLRVALRQLLAKCDRANCLIWAHNLGVARQSPVVTRTGCGCGSTGHTAGRAPS
ncbi:MAG: hypothetical protein HC814_01345 [Rhodobacteraceae bacterium]|nr:hypothetical protein [Paracoccaceae bacterium]